MPLLYIPIALILIAAGRRLSRALGVPGDASALERNLAGYALGLGMLSYTMLGIGLARGLYPIAAWVLLAVFALVGLPEIRRMAQEARSALFSCFHPSPWIWVMISIVTVMGGLALVGVMTPPVKGLFADKPLPGVGLTEWDSIAYHLADPKLYAQHHRIYYIPWEHHSNFAFTAEMWYLWAMLTANGSIALAKMFHWSCWLAAALTVYSIGSRNFSIRTGALGASIFATTLVAFWEAGTAYVDLSTAFFLTVTVLAVIQAVITRERGWLRVSAILMGLALSTKALAGVSLILIAAGLLIWKLKEPQDSTGGRNPGMAVKTAVGWGLLALIVGSPWYMKSFAYTGNPVYPFAYQIFGGKYWNAEAARAYDDSNKSFGLGHSSIDVLLAPWNMTMYPMPGHPAAISYQDGRTVPIYPFLGKDNHGNKPFNDFPTALATFNPILLACLFAPLLLKRSSRLATALALYCGLAFLATFLAMQYVRYALPLVPLLCLLAGWTIDALMAERRITGYALAIFAGVSALFSGAIAAEIAQAQWPMVSGAVTQELYITKGFGAYPAMQYINRELPANAKVVFYGNPLGFYCDREYFWGEKNHSGIVPYDTMHSSQDLLAYFHKTGVTHVLVDARAFGLAPSPNWTGWVYELTAGQGAPIFSERGVMVFALPGGQ